MRRRLKELAEEIAAYDELSSSPELNPDELLNSALTQRATTSIPERTTTALTRTAIGALRTIQKQSRPVERYFEQKDACYAA
jgi:hypothetical protein